VFCGRFCEIHLALGELCVACHQHSDCHMHIRLIRFVLRSKKRQNVAVPAKPKSGVYARSTHGIPDALEGSDREDQNGFDFLRSRMTSVDYQTVSDPCGSPTAAERLTVSLPPTWKHRRKCDCVHCIDTAAERIWLRSYIVEAASRLCQDNVSDSKTMLSTASKQHERLLSNISAQTLAFGLAVYDDEIRVKAMRLFSAVAIYQAHFYVIALNLCEAAFLGKDSKHFSSCYVQAKEALQSNYMPTDRSHVHLAELFYIGATPSLLWPSTAQLVPKSKLSSVDIICAGIGRVSITDIVTPPRPERKSQISGRVSSFVACDGSEQPAESQKSRRGRNTNSLLAAPVKSRPVIAKVSGRTRTSAKEMVQSDELCASSVTTSKCEKTQKTLGIFLQVL